LVHGQLNTLVLVLLGASYVAVAVVVAEVAVRFSAPWAAWQRRQRSPDGYRALSHETTGCSTDPVAGPEGRPMGISELLIIRVFVVVLFGAVKQPRLARSIGRAPYRVQAQPGR
jgi:hypothetical protein